jgi:hypothetical protein
MKEDKNDRCAFASFGFAGIGADNFVAVGHGA